MTHFLDPMTHIIQSETNFKEKQQLSFKIGMFPMCKDHPINIFQAIAIFKAPLNPK